MLAPLNHVNACVSRGQSTSGASSAPSPCTMVVMSSQSIGQNGQVQSRMTAGEMDVEDADKDADAPAGGGDEAATDAPGEPALDGRVDEGCMKPLMQSPCRFLKQGVRRLHRKPAFCTCGGRREDTRWRALSPHRSLVSITPDDTRCAAQHVRRWNTVSPAAHGCHSSLPNVYRRKRGAPVGMDIVWSVQGSGFGGRGIEPAVMKGGRHKPRGSAAGSRGGQIGRVANTAGAYDLTIAGLSPNGRERIEVGTLVGAHLVERHHDHARWPP